MTDYLVEVLKPDGGKAIVLADLYSSQNNPVIGQLETLITLQQIDMKGDCIDDYKYVTSSDGLLISTNNGEIIEYE